MPVDAPRSLDLTVPPLDRDAPAWTHPTAYGACQDLADTARAATLDTILYRSVRDPAGSLNTAVLNPSAFAAKSPTAYQTWHLLLRPNAVQAIREMPRTALEFAVAGWRDDPRIASTL